MLVIGEYSLSETSVAVVKVLKIVLVVSLVVKGTDEISVSKVSLELGIDVLIGESIGIFSLLSITDVLLIVGVFIAVVECILLLLLCIEFEFEFELDLELLTLLDENDLLLEVNEEELEFEFKLSELFDLVLCLSDLVNFLVFSLKLELYKRNR